jgi:hypothetical protein
MTPISVEIFDSHHHECSLTPPVAGIAGEPKEYDSRDRSCRSHKAGTTRLKRNWIFALAALALTSAGAWAQNGVFTAQPVGTTSTAQTVTVKAQVAGTVGVVKVLTAGTSGLDFAHGAGASTCKGGLNLAAGATCTESVTFTPGSPGIRIGAIVVLDDGGKVLATAYLSGVGVGGLGVLIPGNAITVAGVYKTYTSTKDGIPATSANLNQPASLTFDGAGNMYIADSGLNHNRIRKVTAPVPPATDGIISTIAGTGEATYTGDGGPASAATLSAPSGIAIDGAGNMYIADTNNNVVRKITAATGIITRVAGNINGSPGFSGDGGLATSAELNTPQGVSVDVSGNIYIADTSNQRIRKVDVTTGIITTVAGNGASSSSGDGKGTFSGDGGPATKAGLGLPYAVAFDGAGNMYIPDSANNRIRMVDGAGIITTVAGSAASGYSGDGGLATDAVMNTPKGVVLDPGGNFYIADTQNTAIRKVNAKTGIISTLVVNGGSSTLSPAGVLGSAQVYAPIGVFLDGGGNLYFADYYYMLITKIETSQSVLDFTQTPIQVGSKSAPQTQTVENDGNAGLDLTSFTHDKNALVDLPSTTCSLSAPLDVDTDCMVGAIFAPSLALVFPTGAATLQADGNVDVNGNTVSHPSDKANTPLDIVVAGIATPVNATTLALTSSKNPSSFGQKVTFTATVSSGATAGIPDGTVAFMDGTTTLAPAVLLNDLGQASYSSAALTVGAHPLTATFTKAAGTNFLPSTGSLVQDVGEVTATRLVSSANPSVLGASVTFTATVTVTGGGGVAPDGSVTFFDGSTILGNVPLNTATGTATYSTATMANGLHAIVATYGGDAPNGILASSSNVLNQDVQAPSVTVVKSSLDPSNYGLPVTFTATVTSKGTAPPAGVVIFLDGGKQFGTTSLIGTTGIGTFTTSSLAAGAHTVTAAYQGDDDIGASTSAPITQTVKTAQTATTLTATPNPGVAGSPATITATVKVTEGVSTPVGNVTFTDTFNGVAVSLGSPVPLSGGTATIHPSFAPGSHSIVAAYVGDNNDAASSSVPVVLVEVQEQVKLASNSNPSSYGTPVQFTVTVPTVGAVAATGTADILQLGQAAKVGTVTLAGDPATGTFTTSLLPAGTDVITAAYSGDGRYVALTSAAVNQVVNLAQTATTETATPNPAIAGTPVAITAAVKVTQGVSTPAGNVTFADTFNGATVTLGVPTPLAGGAATINQTLAVGAHSIVATYAGDNNDSKSVSSALALDVVKATTTTTVSSSLNPSVVGATVTFTAKVKGNGGTPTGGVNFISDGKTMGPGTLDGTGTTTYSTNALTAGTHAITASYIGDANDAPSTSSPLSQVVGKIPTVTDLGASTTPGANPQVILVGAVLNAVSGPTPTGTITFQTSTGGTVIGTSALDSSGVATLTPNLAAGAYSLVAVYSGDPVHDPSTSKAVDISSTPTGYNLTVTPDKVSVPATQSVTVDVTLTSTNGFTDTIGLGCGSLPSGVNCHFSAATPALAANGTQTVQLTIDTNNPLGGGATAMNAPPDRRGLSLAGLFLPVSLLFGFVFWRFRKRYAAVMTIALVLLMGGSALLVSGCSGFSQKAAAPGTYVIQVVGVGAKSDISHYQNVTLTITAK